jgi:hypothetical protein
MMVFLQQAKINDCLPDQDRIKTFYSQIKEMKNNASGY